MFNFLYEKMQRINISYSMSILYVIFAILLSIARNYTLSQLGEEINLEILSFISFFIRIVIIIGFVYFYNRFEWKKISEELITKNYLIYFIKTSLYIIYFEIWAHNIINTEMPMYLKSYSILIMPIASLILECIFLGKSFAKKFISIVILSISYFYVIVFYGYQYPELYSLMIANVILTIIWFLDELTIKKFNKGLITSKVFNSFNNVEDSDMKCIFNNGLFGLVLISIYMVFQFRFTLPHEILSQIHIISNFSLKLRIFYFGNGILNIMEIFFMLKAIGLSGNGSSQIISSIRPIISSVLFSKVALTYQVILGSLGSLSGIIYSIYKTAENKLIEKKE